MRYLKALLVGVALTSFVASPAHAQDASIPPLPDNPGEGLSPQIAQLPALPSVFVSDLFIVNARTFTSEIEGTFTFVNSDEHAHGGIRYAVELLDPAPAETIDGIISDTSVVYDRVVDSTFFTIPASQQQATSFTYTLPSVPAGEYRLRIQALNVLGEPLGWADSPLTISSDSLAGYAVTEGGYITSGSEGSNTPPLNGFVTAANEDLTLGYSTRNIGSAPLTTSPRLRVFKALESHTTAVQEVIGNPITIAPNATITGEITAQGQGESGPYYAILEFIDVSEEVVSGPFEYRWVTDGPYAKILSTNFINLTGQEGQDLTLEFHVAGRANTDGPFVGALTAALYDGEQLIEQVSSEELDLANTSQSIEVTFSLTRSLVEPQIVTTLVDQEGSTLHEQTIPFSVPSADEPATALELPFEESAEGFSLMLLGAGALVLLLIGFIVWKLWSPKQPPPTISGIAILIGLVAIGLFSAGYSAEFANARSQGIVVRNGLAADPNATYTPPSYTELFVNKPKHQNSYDFANIPVSFRVVDRLCNCSPSGRYVVDILYDASGALHPNYVPPSTLEQIRQVELNTVAPSGTYYSQQSNWSGLLAIPSLPQTTLQFYGRQYTSGSNPALVSWHVVHVFVNSENPVPTAPPRATSPTPTAIPSTSDAQCTVAPNGFATNVIDFSPLTPYDYNNINTDETTILGPNDGVPQPFERVDQNTPGFVIVSFGNNEKIYDGPESDIRVYLNDFIQQEPEESFEVLVSQDGGDFVSLGIRNPTVVSTDRLADTHMTEDFDIAATGLPYVTQVMIRNTHTLDIFGTGPDLDAIEALHLGNQCACSDETDNDGDNLIDADDPGCRAAPDDPDTYDPEDNDEFHIPAFGLPGFRETD